MKMTKTAQEKIMKEEKMLALIEVLADAGYDVRRINDYGTLAFPCGEIEGKERFITLKVVMAKEYDTEKETGFDIGDAEYNYEDRIAQDAIKAKAKELKDAAALADRAKKEAKKEAEKALKDAKDAAKLVENPTGE